MRKLSSMVVGLLLVIGLCSIATPAESADTPKKRYAPVEGGHFNQPRSTYLSQTRIERTILGAINHSRKGEQIHISLYSFDRMNMAWALIHARKRGVRVQILINDHQVTRAMRKLKSVLGGNKRKKNFIHVCAHSCRSNHGKHHTKFYLFSKAGTAENVTMVGSANLTTNAIRNQWNDLLVLNDKPRVYNTYLKVFNEMRRDRNRRAIYQDFRISPHYRLGVMPFWRPSPSHDPIMKILDKVRCTGVAKGYGNNGRTIVRVSMHAWDNQRGAWLADKMRKLWARGCDVRMLYGMAGAQVRSTWRVSTDRGKVPVRADGFDTDGDLLIDKYSHQKYLVISGRMLKKNVDRVYTGSSNWSASGLRGDEIIFQADGRYIFKQWFNNFTFIWDHYSRPDGSSNLQLPGERAARSTLDRQAAAQAGGPAWEDD